MINSKQVLIKHFNNTYKNPNGQLNLFRIQDFFYYPQKNQKKSMCLKNIENGTIIIYCIDCGLQINSIICKECFDNGNHEGHKFQFYASNDGICDCGNENVWKASGFCKNHSGKNQQKIMIDEKQKQKFIKDWQTIFIWLLQLNDNNMQKCKDFANKILTFLKNLSQNSEYYSSLIGSLLVKKLELNSINSDCFLDSLLIKIKQKTLVHEFSQFFKSLFLSEEFKKHLTISFLKNINQIPIINESEQKGFEYLIFYQVLTHQQFVLHALSEKYLLAYNKTVNRIGIHDFSFHLNYAYKYICNSQKVKYQYWKTHINSNHNITCICLYQPFTEEIWNRKKRSPQQENFLINIIEFQYDFFFQLVFKIAEIIQQDKSLLLKAISDLYKHILKLQMTTNRYSLPYHRMLCVFLFTYFQFDLSNIDSNLQKLINYLQLNKQKGLENKIITPVLNCIQNYLLLKDKLKIVSGVEKKLYGIYNNAKMILNIDMLFIKICMLLDQNNYHILPNFSDKISELNNYLQRIKLINQLCISEYEQINIQFLITKNNQKHYQAAQNLVSSFLSTMKICKNQQLKQFQEQFFTQEQDLGPYLKNVSKHNKTSRNFTYISPNKIYLDIEYYCTKSKVKNILITNNNNVLPLKLSKEKITRSAQTFFMKAITSSSLVNLEKILHIIIQICQDNQFERAINKEIYLLILKQIIKLYYISKVISFGQISNALKQVIRKAKISSLISKQLTQQINQIFKQKNVLLNESEQSQKKIKEQIKNKKMNEIRNKQNKFSLLHIKGQKIMDIQIQQQQQCCLICKKNLKDGTIIVYPTLMQFSNLSYSSKLQNIQRLILQEQNQNSKSFYQLLQSSLKLNKKQNMVFINCEHLFHYSCIQHLPNDTKCPICKRFCNIFVPIATNDLGSTQLQYFFQRIVNFSLDQDFPLIYSVQSDFYLNIIFKSTIEILSYLGSLQIQVFVKKFIKLYKNMVAIQKIIYNRLTEMQKKNFQQGMNKQYKLLKIYLIQKGSKIDYDKYVQHDLQILTKNILHQYLKNDKIVLRDRLQQYISNDNKYNELLINRLSFIHYLITPQCQEPYFFKQSNQQMLKTLSLNKKQPILITLVQPLFFRQLPPKFLPLNKYRIQCPNCKKLSNGKCICLLCNWEGCKGCQSMKLWQHTKQAHFRQSIFLNIESTKLIYVSQRFAYVSRGLYVNEYGDQFKIKQDWDKFSLDAEQYQKVKMRIIEYNIESYLKQQNHFLYQSFDF